MWKDSDSDEDRLLVTRCREGDASAFETLVRKYQQSVLNLVYHYLGSRNDAEDVSQKIFTKIYFSLAKFDQRRPFFPWLYRIAANQCYDELRKLRRHKVHTFSELSLEDSNRLETLISQNEPPLETEEDQKQLAALLHRTLDQLPEQQRTAIVLRDLEGIPYPKMAEIMQCTEQAARLKVFRARTRLRELLERAMRK